MQKKSLVVFSLLIVSILFIAGCQEAVGGSGRRYTATQDSSYRVSSIEVASSGIPREDGYGSGKGLHVKRYGSDTTERTNTNIFSGEWIHEYSIGSNVYGPGKSGCWRILEIIHLNVEHVFRDSSTSVQGSTQRSDVRNVGEIKNSDIFIIASQNEIACAQQSASQIKTFTEEEFSRAIKF